MAVLTDDEPRNTRRLAVVMLLSGIALGVITSFVAYEFTYKGFGADFDDYKRGGVTALIVMGIIISFVLIFMGAVTYWSERLTRPEPPQYPTYPR